MCHKTVNTYPSATQIISECYKNYDICDTICFLMFLTQETSDKVVTRCFLYLIVFPNGIKLEKAVIKLFLNILYNSALSQ